MSDEKGVIMKHKPVLYVGKDRDSKVAKTALEKAHIDFQVIRIKDPKKEKVEVPQLLSVKGFFPGLNSILWYADVYAGE